MQAPSCFAPDGAWQDWVVVLQTLPDMLLQWFRLDHPILLRSPQASEAGLAPLMTCPPPEQRAGMSQNEHFAVKAGMDFRSARTSENISRAFSIP
jgi:hypothetical protein